jgi:hypothetical protein
VRTLIACATVSVAILLGQRALITALLPYFDIVIRLLQSDFVASLRIAEVKGQWMIQMTPFLLRAVPLTDQLALRSFVELPPFFVGVTHALVPVVLLIAAIASWPFASYRDAITRVVLAIVSVPLVLASTTPLLLAGRLQMWIIELAMQHGAGSREPALVTAMIFMESGGRWLLPLMLAVASVVISHRLCIGPPMLVLPKGQSSVVDAAQVVFPPVSVKAVTPRLRSGSSANA